MFCSRISIRSDSAARDRSCCSSATQRDRDRCDHPWWGSFRGVRVSLTRWADRDVRTKAEAYEILDELKRAIRNGTFDPKGIEPPAPVSPMTFRRLAEVYVERHVKAKQRSKAGNMNWRLRPLMERFGDRPVSEIKTADVEDWIADLCKRACASDVSTSWPPHL